MNRRELLTTFAALTLTSLGIPAVAGQQFSYPPLVLGKDDLNSVAEFCTFLKIGIPDYLQSAIADCKKHLTPKTQFYFKLALCKFFTEESFFCSEPLFANVRQNCHQFLLESVNGKNV